MNISHIEHIGIAVKSIEESLPYYENVLGFKCYAIVSFTFFCTINSPASLPAAS